MLKGSVIVELHYITHILYEEVTPTYSLVAAWQDAL